MEEDDKVPDPYRPAAAAAASSLNVEQVEELRRISVKLLRQHQAAVKEVQGLVRKLPHSLLPEQAGTVAFIVEALRKTEDALRVAVVELEFLPASTAT